MRWPNSVFRFEVASTRMQEFANPLHFFTLGLLYTICGVPADSNYIQLRVNCLKEDRLKGEACHEKLLRSRKLWHPRDVRPGSCELPVTDRTMKTTV